MSKQDAGENRYASDPTVSTVPNDGRPKAKTDPAKGSQETTPLAKLVREEKLPQCIRITKNFLVLGSHIRFKKGDVLMLHFVYTKQVIHATDSKKGKVLRLPLHNKQEFEILPLDPLLDDKVYDGTAALINAKPLPDRVRVVDAHCSTHLEEQQCSDDVVQIEKIEVDKRFGKVLVGKLLDPVSEHVIGPCRFSQEMTFSSYTTMVESEFQRLTQLKTRRFPLRVRIPDTSLGQRNRKVEQVLRLLDSSDEECVLATRSGDSLIYCLPLSAPFSLERAPLPVEEQIPAFVSPLYANINRTWNVVDPLQAGMSYLLEEIPQPIEEVLEHWLASWEGKHRIKFLDRKKDKEIKRLESAVESYKRQVCQKGSMETPPSRPPRPARRSSETLTPSIPDRPPKSIDVRKRLSEPTFDQQTNQYADDNGNSSSDEIYSEVISEDKALNSWTDEKKTKYGELLKKYNDIKEENLKLKNEKKRLHERVQCLEEIVDEGEEYSMIVNRSEIPAKPDSYAKIKATKQVQTELEVSNQEKEVVPVPHAKSNSSPQPVKEKKPPVPIRTDSRNYIQSANLPVPSPRVSLDDAGKPARVDSGIIMSDSQGSEDEKAAPKTTTTPKPPARVSKLPSQPPSDPISPTLAAKPNLDVGHLPPMGLPFAVHSGLTKEEVVSFLEARKLGKYSESFLQNDIDGELLMALDEEIMIDELGLTKLDARKLSLVLKKHKGSDSVFLES
ncbi:uncharacterized protein LOC121411699 [Lytechinus variegatus]|uniref:uncharacterized protein LOC121411699 n=1 Tax=Lytechinus variegatus TaxID=7654 RepID=UPI001BB1F279|nr:uncharacterized protein LOC121411699 [Lytechinus variegatus]